MTFPRFQQFANTAIVGAASIGQRRTPYLPRPSLDRLRDRRIREMVSYAARVVPYYRDMFAREHLDPREIHGAKELDQLPALNRDQVRCDPGLFVAHSRAARAAVSFVTSGSTGTPIEIQHDRRSLLANIAFGERERDPVRKLCGGVFRPKELYVGYDTSTFKRVTAFYQEQTRLPLTPRRRFVSVLEPFDSVVAMLEAERPDVLVGYGGWIDLFLKTIDASGLNVALPRVVMYMGEAMPTGGRDFIEQRFKIPVLSRYNAVEAFKIGFSCEERTGFHLHEDLCHVRVGTPDGRTAPAGEAGEVIISNLVNRATVLLNYPIGDMAAEVTGVCPCGRSFRRLSELDGRVEDILTLRDGRFVHPRAVWQVFKDLRDVLQYQLTQSTLDRYQLTLVTADEPTFHRVMQTAQPELMKLLDAGARIDARWTAAIDRSEHKKFRAVASMVTPRSEVAHTGPMG